MKRTTSNRSKLGLRKARAESMIKAAHGIALRNRIQEIPEAWSSSDAAAIASASAATSAGEALGSTSWRTASAAARSPLRLSSQRGLSGNPRQNTAYRREG